MVERSAVNAKMNEVWNTLRAVLAKTHPYRGDVERQEITFVLAVLLAEARKWQGKEQLPLYERGAMLDALFVEDRAEVLEVLDEFFRGRRQLPIEAEDLM